ncbi:secreted protein [Beggiatoa sp. PS]|nr:secreted protein [Beggiatoa sp. PS]
MYKIIFQSTFLLLSTIFSLSVVANGQDFPINCNTMSQANLAQCEAINATNVKLQQFEKLLSIRDNYLSKVKGKTEPFCKVDKPLKQNERKIESLVQDILPFNCNGMKTLFLGCETVNEKYARLTDFKAQLDQKIEQIRRSCSPIVESGKSCTAENSLSAFMPGENSTIIRHQAHSPKSDKFNVSQIDIKEQMGGKEYSSEVIPQQWRSPYVFVVSIDDYKNDHLLFQVYCRSDFSLAYSKIIHAAKIGLKTRG